MPSAATWIDLEIIILSKSERDKCHMVSLIVESKKKVILMNLFTKQKQTTEIENKPMVSKGERVWGGNKLGVWD